MIIHGSVIYRAPIACHTCGKPALSNHRIELNGVDSSSIEEYLQHDFKQHIPNIPVGWSVSGRDKLFCGDCK